MTVSSISLKQPAKTAEIYHSPQSPGYTSWVGASSRGGKLQASFVQVTGNPRTNPRVGEAVWSGVDIDYVTIQSDDDGKTWKTCEEDSCKGVPHAWSGQPATVLPDGRRVRRVNAEDLQAAKVSARPTAYLQFEKDGKWSNPTYPLDPDKYTVQITRIQPMRDGRLLATGNFWDAKAGTRTRNNANKWAFLISDDGGKTWRQALDNPDECPANEWSVAELPNGDFLALMRTWVGSRANQVRRQAVLSKKGNAWHMGPITDPGFPHSGHPELLAVKNGEAIISFATTGSAWTKDKGKTWHSLDFKSPYYPRAVEHSDGTVRVFGHRGTDDDYRAKDQAVLMGTLKFNTEGDKDDEPTRPDSSTPSTPSTPAPEDPPQYTPDPRPEDDKPPQEADPEPEASPEPAPEDEAPAPDPATPDPVLPATPDPDAEPVAVDPVTGQPTVMPYPTDDFPQPVKDGEPQPQPVPQPDNVERDKTRPPKPDIEPKAQKKDGSKKSFKEPFEVTISCKEKAATIYWTEGRDAIPSYLSNEYQGPILIVQDTTIKAVAYDAAGNVSGYTRRDYKFSKKKDKKDGKDKEE